ncbi:MAG TPA: DUF1592 domain-containing protein [Polyangiaceae bacterium]|nr:DUF1592 domain-containing protein [Polyangiaceae bacterium]
MRIRARLAMVCSVVLATIGCEGNIESDRTGPGALDPETGLPVDPETGRPVDPETGEPLPPFSAAPGAMRRLSATQFQNAVRDLFENVRVTTALEPDAAVNGFIEIGVARGTISPAAAEKFEKAAYEIAGQVVAADRRAKFVGCTPAASVDTTCTRAYVERVGRRAFRRPLSSDEVGRYVGLAETAARRLNDFYAGIEFVTAGLLQSPNFAFRVEVGEPDPGNAGRLRYTSIEMATRLSFLIWNSIPDDALLRAGEAGELVAEQGLTTQIERLVSDARARTAMNNFHFERFNLEALDTLNKDRARFAAMTDTLGAAMREDVLRTADYIVFEQGGDYRDLFDTPVTFSNAELAGLYGVAKPASGTALTLLPAGGPRLGLLGKAGFLAMNAHSRETSPTLRGKFVRERLLCESIPAPPPEVVTIVPEPNPNAPTMRERLAVHRQEASCARCHGAMDPIGLSFENFDAIGSFRENDNGHALDLTGEIDGTTFDGPRELAALLRNRASANECAVRQLYRYAVGHVESAGEEVVIKSLSQRFSAGGYRLKNLIREVVVSDGFRFMKKESP